LSALTTGKITANNTTVDNNGRTNLVQGSNQNAESDKGDFLIQFGHETEKQTGTEIWNPIVTVASTATYLRHQYPHCRKYDNL
jgi:hypothetical protein